MNVWTNTSVRRSNGGEVQPGFGFPHSLIAALQEKIEVQFQLAVADYTTRLGRGRQAEATMLAV
jgi:hypothetical protein